MTEEERLKDKKQRQWSLVLIIIGFVIFTMYQWNNRPSRANSTPTQIENAHGENYSHAEETLGGVCDECGRHFSGRGYTEVSEGVWQETQEPYQSFICSKSCGLKHTGDWNNILGKKDDGRVYDNEPCGMCNGTGIEEVHNSLGDDSRICPMCDGKGYKSY